MFALIRYTLATMLHAQRYLAPVLLFLVLLAVLAGNSSEPLLPIYASFAAGLFVCACWFTVALLSVEDPAHRAIIVVAAGRSRRVLAAAILVALLACVVLAGLGLAVPLVVTAHPVSGPELLAGAEAELTCAVAGIAVGLICSRLVIRRQGYALLLTLVLLGFGLFVPGLAPVNAVVGLLSRAQGPGPLLAPAAGLLAVALVLLAASATATQFLATRRD